MSRVVAWHMLAHVRARRKEIATTHAFRRVYAKVTRNFRDGGGTHPCQQEPKHGSKNWVSSCRSCQARAATTFRQGRSATWSTLPASSRAMPKAQSWERWVSTARSKTVTPRRELVR